MTISSPTNLNTASASSGSHTMSVSAGSVASGATMILQVQTFAETVTSAGSAATSGETWTPVYCSANAAFQILICNVATTGTKSIVFTAAGSPTYGMICNVSSVTGGPLSLSVTTTLKSGGPSTSMTTNSLTPAAAGELYLAGFEDDSGNYNLSSPTNSFTFFNSPSGFSSNGWTWLVGTSTSAVSTGCSLSGSDTWESTLISLKASSGGTPATASGSITLSGSATAGSGGSHTASGSITLSGSATAIPTPTATVPDPPTDVAAVAGDTTAAVSWLPPFDDGGSPITSYTVTSSPGGFTATISVAPAPVWSGINAFTNPSAAGWPDITNTGVPTGTSLTASGDIASSADNQVIDSMHVTGSVTITHNNVTLKRCLVEQSSDNGDVVSCTGTGALIQDCEISGGSGTHGSYNGVQGDYTTVQRCYIHNCENMVKWEKNSTLEDSYMNKFYADYAGATPHYDGVESNGGGPSGGCVVNHNTIDNDTASQQTSAVNFTCDFGTIVGVTITNNLLRGGTYVIYMDKKTYSISGATIDDNRFGRTQQYGTIDDTGATYTHTPAGNVYDDDNTVAI